MKRITACIYGAGKEYDRFSSVLFAYRDMMEVLFIVTTSEPKYKRVDSFDCVAIDNACFEGVDYVIIAIKNWKEVLEKLYSRGIKKTQIIPSHVFYTHNFDIKKYLTLRESRISIISNFCNAGLIYEELGMEFLSPTIKMSCVGMQYIEFLKDMRKYLERSMQPRIDRVIENGIEDFVPKGYIQDSDIEWSFPHSANAIENVDNWNKRRKRVNFDNIAVIMTIFSDEEAVEFSKIPIRKKIGFYYRELNLDSICYIPGWEDEKIRLKNGFNWAHYVNDHITSYWGGIELIDWIRFLSGEPEFIRFEY